MKRLAEIDAFEASAMSLATALNRDETTLAEVKVLAQWLRTFYNTGLQDAKDKAYAWGLKNHNNNDLCIEIENMKDKSK